MRDYEETQFGRRLREHRERSGLTQEELAERAGLSVDAISALERGLRRHPHPSTVRSIAAAFALSDVERADLIAMVGRAFRTNRLDHRRAMARRGPAACRHL